VTSRPATPSLATDLTNDPLSKDVTNDGGNAPKTIEICMNGVKQTILLPDVQDTSDDFFNFFPVPPAAAPPSVERARPSTVSGAWTTSSIAQFRPVATGTVPRRIECVVPAVQSRSR